MFHNMKADIIYYKTATDFELEFNLCGCCRMRLLSDKMQDKKSFVHSLARAVSRSSIILIAGPLFGDDGSIKTVADAINTKLEAADSKAYGMEDENIQIIKGSIPLVSPEGYFGGCIIESGPQTMILLTDNKNIRKAIMQNLIHPYITELAAGDDVTAEEIAEVQEETEAIEENLPQEDIPEEITEETTQEVEQIPIESEAEIIIDNNDNNQDLYDINSINQPESKDINLQDDIIMDDGGYDALAPDNSYDAEDVGLYFEASKPEHRKMGHYYNSYDEFEDLPEDFDNEKPRKNKLSLSVFIISIILLLVIIVLCYCIFLVPMQSGASPVENLQEIFKTMFG